MFDNRLPMINVDEAQLRGCTKSISFNFDKFVLVNAR